MVSELNGSLSITSPAPLLGMEIFLVQMAAFWPLKWPTVMCQSRKLLVNINVLFPKCSIFIDCTNSLECCSMQESFSCVARLS